MPLVARAPALQCTMTMELSGINPAPILPIVVQASLSSFSIARASARRSV